ncbi:hypothetical protein E8E11_007115 [Didymella keratinophila]|nr:hypothetical protein E8E11_007115 [Didymella keratinophila]
MAIGRAIGVALSTFAITNIDDLFVLVTFFAEASTPASETTPLKIVLRQYIGFNVIIGISMIGYALAFAMPTEPIGFLGLFPIVVEQDGTGEGAVVEHEILAAQSPGETIEFMDQPGSKESNISTSIIGNKCKTAESHT